jgi:soluble lytic murein transglycosylase-like protein
MLVNSIKIGIAVAGLAVAAVTVPDAKDPVNTDDVRIPDRIDRASPPSLQMYKYIKAYADTFDIPLRYAFGIAYCETHYQGPFNWKYNPAQTSCSGAEGPMQILLSTARYINRDNVSRHTLRTDIEYNVRTGLKYLRRLHDRYHRWDLVFGYYNTGYPQVNGYARNVLNYKMK